MYTVNELIEDFIKADDEGMITWRSDPNGLAEGTGEVDGIHFIALSGNPREYLANYGATNDEEAVAGIDDDTLIDAMKAPGRYIFMLFVDGEGLFETVFEGAENLPEEMWTDSTEYKLRQLEAICDEL